MLMADRGMTHLGLSRRRRETRGREHALPERLDVPLMGIVDGLQVHSRDLVRHDIRHQSGEWLQLNEVSQLAV